MTGKPKISIVVCTYNRVNLLEEVLYSLKKQTLSPTLFEVLVIDNNSTDGTWKFVETAIKNQSNFRVFKETAQGVSHARNRGWQEARGDYVAYIDDDAKATPEWCERILNAFETVTPKPTVVGGKILPWYDHTPPSWFTDEFEIRTWGEDPGFLESPVKKYGFSGSNMAILKEVLFDVGGFSPKFGPIGSDLWFGEEAELFSKVSDEKQLFWYDPRIKVFHFTPERNTKIFYYFKRAYLGGKARYRIEKCDRLSFTYLKKIKCMGVFLLKTPIDLFFSKKAFKTAIVEKIRVFCSLIGFLLG